MKFSTVFPFRLPGNHMMCLYCGSKYEVAAEFRAHMQDEHKKFNRRAVFNHVTPENFLKLDCSDIQCRLCKKQFLTLQEVTEHLKETHHAKLYLDGPLEILPYKFDERRILCGICLTKHLTLRHLGRHLTSHFQKFMCSICAKSFINITSLKHHMISCKMAGKFLCYKCKTAFDTLELRREHVMESKKCWRYTCYECGQRFMTYVERNTHISTVHNIQPTKYTCTECSEVLENKTAWRQHIRSFHVTLCRHICQYCGKGFDSFKCLNEHLVTHTKDKSFVCPDCDKPFGTKKSLIQHSWIHKEYKRFECKICVRKFNQRVSWKTHMKNRHPDLVDF